MSILDPDSPETDRSTEATFSSGRLDSEDIEGLREDLVWMVPDGLHSTVRRLAFGPEERYAHHLGSYLSPNSGSPSASSPPPRPRLPRRRRPAAARRGQARLDAVGRDRLAEAARKAPDFHCDAMAQIRMDQWSLGRVALLGDAGYCPSPSRGAGPLPCPGQR